jgi:hypothetical protein
MKQRPSSVFQKSPKTERRKMQNNRPRVLRLEHARPCCRDAANSLEGACESLINQTTGFAALPVVFDLLIHSEQTAGCAGWQ